MSKQHRKVEKAAASLADVLDAPKIGGYERTLLTVAQAADRLGISENTLRRRLPELKEAIHLGPRKTFFDSANLPQIEVADVGLRAKGKEAVTNDALLVAIHEIRDLLKRALKLP